MHKSIVHSLRFLLALGMAATSSLAGTHELNLGPQYKLDLTTAQFRVWVPDTLETVRGVFVLTPGKNADGRSGASSAEWQALATKQQFAIIAAYLKDDTGEVTYPSKPGVADLLKKALQQAAIVSEHPEIDTVPRALWGYAEGAEVSILYAQSAPERILTIGLTKSQAGGGPLNTGGSTETPMLLTTGRKEKPEYRISNERSWEQQRKLGALWALTVHPNEGSEMGNTLAVILPFMDESITLRLGPPPDPPARAGTRLSEPTKLKEADGWLGHPRTRDISMYKDYVGNKRDACWFPGEKSARAWRTYLGADTP